MFQIKFSNILFSNHKNNVIIQQQQQKGLSNYLNGRASNLNSDLSSATSLPAVYDTDIENFWTNISKAKTKINFDLFVF